MAKYRVIGADAETGINRREIVSANDPKEAQAIASARGLFVSDIDRLEDEQPQNAISQSPHQPQINIVNTNTNTHTNTNDALRPIHPGGIIPALLSFFIPGLGQLVKGQLISAIIWLFAVIVGYFLLILPGIALHIWCVIDAYKPRYR